MDSIRVLPYDADAERAVIGCMLYDSASVGEVLDILTKDDFYMPQYGIFFEAITECYEADQQTDATLIIDKLKQKGVDETQLSTENIASFFRYSKAEYIRPYAKVVADKSMSRKAIALLSELSDSCYEQRIPISDVLDRAETEIAGLAMMKNTTGFITLGDAAQNAYKESREAAERGSDVVGIPSGFTDIDKVTKGFRPSEMTIIAARPSMGKTALVLNIARHIVVNLNKSAAIFSLEMASTELARRLLSSQTHISADKIYTGKLDDGEWDEIQETVESFQQAGLYIDDVSDENIADLRAKCRKAKRQYNAEIIFVDYLQLVTSTGRVESRQQEVAKISRALRNIARELKVPVIALAQLSRECEHRSDKRPVMSDIRESGQIEQDAANILFIHRELEDEPETKRKLMPDEAEIIFAKVRNGKPGRVKLKWIGNQFRFANMEQSDYDRSESIKAKDNEKFAKQLSIKDVPFV